LDEKMKSKDPDYEPGKFSGGIREFRNLPQKKNQ